MAIPRKDYLGFYSSGIPFIEGHMLSLVVPSRDLDQLVEKTKAYMPGAKSSSTLQRLLRAQSSAFARHANRSRALCL